MVTKAGRPIPTPTRAVALAAAAALLLAGCGASDPPQPTLKQVERKSQDPFMPKDSAAAAAAPKNIRTKGAGGRGAGEKGRGTDAGSDDGADPSGSAPSPGGSSTGGAGSGGAPAPPAGRAAIRAAKDALREMIARTNAGDPGVCTSLFTRRHIEEVTGMTGKEGLARCREDVSSPGPEIKLYEVEGVRIEGDGGLIQFTSGAKGYAKRQVLRLAWRESGWRFDGDGSGDA